MQKFISSFILAAVAAGLAGCRADSGSHASSEMDRSNTSVAPGSQAAPSPPTESAPRSTAPPAKVTDNRPLVVCFGDSLTAGFGAEDGQSYPDYLQKDLDHDGFHSRVVNEGISGNTTKDGVDRLAGVIAMKPDVVVLEFGGNDGLRGLKVQTTRDNLAMMIDGLKKGGARVVLAGITLPPDYGPDYVNAFTANYAALERTYNVPLLPFLLKDAYGVTGMMQADGIHATSRGNQVVAHNVAPFVERFLHR